MPGEINQVKSLLRDESKISLHSFKDIRGRMFVAEATEVSALPILHNDGKIFLQFNGWSINLSDDGTWFWEDTTGG